jgi:16S rRNA (guanine966-N2)-methyltransferase
MKIISGRLRGRIIKTTDDKNFRPTTTKTREALFSMLTSGRFLDEEGTSVLQDAVVMDLFAGAGSLGFEALSRGASKVVAIDIEQERINMVKENATRFGEIANITLLRADAAMLPKARMQCDIVFMDPPYGKNLAAPALKSITNQGWLKENAVVIVEIDKKEKFEALPGFEFIDERTYGKTKIVILIYHGKLINE